jgi:hypothetical protein
MSAQPLIDAEFDRLAEVLQRCGGKHAMNIEMLDGFLAALICGPETVLPSEYLPTKIWGDDQTNESTFDTQSVVREFLSLIMRHLAYEHHPDPEMRPYKEPMSIERREHLIVGVAASVPAIYHYFSRGAKIGNSKALFC